MEAEAMFVRDGDGYVATILTQGGWDPTIANGGTVLALVGHHLHDVPTLVPMTLARFTADLMRPVPVGRRLDLSSRIVREGKKIQLVELAVSVDGVEHALVTALRLRDDDLTGSDTPRGTTDDRPAETLVSPDDSMPLSRITPTVPGFLRAVDMRRADLRDGSGTGAWIRLSVPVVAGEPVNATARMTFAFDFANLVGVTLHSPDVSLINPDVTAQVLRPPESEWIAITGATRVNEQLGRGISQALLSDDSGVVAAVSMSQLIQTR